VGNDYEGDLGSDEGDVPEFLDGNTEDSDVSPNAESLEPQTDQPDTVLPEDMSLEALSQFVNAGQYDASSIGPLVTEVFDRLASLLPEGLGTSDSKEAFGVPDFVERLADGFQQGLGLSADEARGLAQQVADGIQGAIDENRDNPDPSESDVSGNDVDASPSDSGASGNGQDAVAGSGTDPSPDSAPSTGNGESIRPDDKPIKEAETFFFATVAAILAALASGAVAAAAALLARLGAVLNEAYAWLGVGLYNLGQRLGSLWQSVLSFFGRQAPAAEGQGAAAVEGTAAEIEAFAERARRLGLTENPNRPGSWGRYLENGKFKEAARIDPGIPGALGWGGKTHIHIDGQKPHLPLDTPLPGENSIGVRSMEIRTLNFLHDAVVQEISFVHNSTGVKELVIKAWSDPDCGYEDWAGKLVSLSLQDVIIADGTLFGHVMGEDSISGFEEGISPKTQRLLSQLVDAGVSAPTVLLRITFHSGSSIDIACDEIEVTTEITDTDGQTDCGKQP
jgi:hypothetical protein